MQRRRRGRVRERLEEVRRDRGQYVACKGCELTEIDMSYFLRLHVFPQFGKALFFVGVRGVLRFDGVVRITCAANGLWSNKISLRCASRHQHRWTAPPLLLS